MNSTRITPRFAVRIADLPSSADHPRELGLYRAVEQSSAPTTRTSHNVINPSVRRPLFPGLAALAAFSLLLGLPSPTAAQELIPAARRTDWIPSVNVGVPGGIPTNRTQLIDVTQSPYNADRTGATNATPAIQAAINAAAAGQIVYLPAGKYRLDSTLYVGPSRDNITIRGAGMDLTVLDARMSNVAITLGSSSDYNWSYPSQNNRVTGGNAKGSTVLTVGDTSPFVVGSLVNLAIEDETNHARIANGSAPVVSVSGFRRSNRQMTRIVNKTSSTLTIFPGIYGNHQSKAIDVYWASQQTDFSGIENLTIECMNGNAIFGIQFEQAYACWISGVRVYKAANYGFSIANSLNCEIRQSFADQRSTNGTNGGGILFGMSSGCLIEDNIVKGFFPLIEVNAGACGNVLAYNFCYDSSVFGLSGVAINTNHGPHNSFNLYEGNVASTLQSDGYFGSASDDTVFRNWLHGTNPGVANGAHSVVLNRFTRNYNLVGNVFGWPGKSDGAVSFGNPNMGNGQSIGTAQPAQGDFWDDWKMSATLTTRSSDTSGIITLSSGSLNTFQWVSIIWNSGNSRASFNPQSVSGNTVTFSYGGTALPPQGTTLEVWPGPSGFQERDMDVEPSTLLKGNIYSTAQMKPAGEGSLGGELPQSLYRNSKPSWFGTLPWPAFDPQNPNYNLEAIPAGYRYFRQAAPPAGNNSPPSNVRVIRST